MTPVFCCGFECGVLETHWGSNPGVSISTTTVRSGVRSLRINPTAAANSSTTRSGVLPTSNLWVYRFYVRFATLPNVDTEIAGVGSTGKDGLYFKQSDSSLYAGGNLGTIAFGATGVAITTGTWYLIDLKMKCDANPHLVDVQVDGTACGQHSIAANAVTNSSFVLGNVSTTATLDVFFDDIIVSNTLADYPIGAGYVNHFVPTSDGTHTSTGTTTVKGTIATPVGTAITSATTDAFNWVNGVPLLGGATDNTRLINAQTAASTTYVEVVFGPAPTISTPTVAPRAVEVLTADREATTATGDFKTKLNDNGTESDVIARGVVAGVVTDRYARKHYATAPTGGAWTVSAGAGNFNNIRARFGYSSDATPDQYWRGIMIEAEFAPAAGGGGEDIVDPMGMMGFFGI